MVPLALIKIISKRQCSNHGHRYIQIECYIFVFTIYFISKKIVISIYEFYELNGEVRKRLKKKSQLEF